MTWITLAVVFLLLQIKTSLGDVSITVSGATTFQTIDGFGCNINGNDPTNYIGPVLDNLVNNAGMTLFRVIKDREDWAAQSSDYPYTNTYGSQTNFLNLWSTIGYLNQLGITNGISISLMGQGPAWMSTNWLDSTTGHTLGCLRLDKVDDWANMVGSMVAYAKLTNGLKFNLIEPDNEPEQDENGSSPTNRLRTLQSSDLTTDRAGCTNALHALAAYFETNNLTDMRLIGPSLSHTMSLWDRFYWINTMMSDPLTRSYVAHVGIHDYYDTQADTGSGDNNLYTSAYDFLNKTFPGTNFWVTEFNKLGNGEYGLPDTNWSYGRDTADFLISHLNNGAAGAEVFTGSDSWMSYLNHGTGGLSAWGLFDTNQQPRYGYWTVSQISKYVQPGAQCIGVSGITSPFNLVPFYGCTAQIVGEF